jgi:hypothetical protein
VRRVLHEPRALAQRLVHEADVALLQVPQAAVHHLGGLRGGARGEVVAFDERRAQTAAGGVERAPGAGDAAADHQHVEGGVGQSAKGLGSVERAGHGATPATGDETVGTPGRSS